MKKSAILYEIMWLLLVFQCPQKCLFIFQCILPMSKADPSLCLDFKIQKTAHAGFYITEADRHTVITSRRNPLQNEKVNSVISLMSPPPNTQILRRTVLRGKMRHLEWRPKLYSIGFSQFRKLTRQIRVILQHLTVFTQSA